MTPAQLQESNNPACKCGCEIIILVLQLVLLRFVAFINSIRLHIVPGEHDIDRSFGILAGCSRATSRLRIRISTRNIAPRYLNTKNPFEVKRTLDIEHKCETSSRLDKIF